MTEPKTDAPKPPETAQSVAPVVRRSPQSPEFLEDYADIPELEPLVQAFVAGNYARLRELEHELQKGGGDPDTLELARELVERTEPSPTAKKLLFLSIGFFVFLVAWLYLGVHAH